MSTDCKSSHNGFLDVSHSIGGLRISGWIGQLSLLFSSLFHAGQAAIKLPSAEASKRAQCTSPGQYAPYIKGIMKTP